MSFRKFFDLFIEGASVDDLRNRHHFLQAAGDLYWDHVRRHHPDAIVYSKGKFEKQLIRDLSELPLPEVERKYLGFMNGIFAAIFDHQRRRIANNRAAYVSSLKALENYKTPCRHDLPAEKSIDPILSAFATQIDDLNMEVASAATDHVSRLWEDHFDTLSALVRRCDDFLREISGCIERAQVETEKFRERRRSRANLGFAAVAGAAAVIAVFNPFSKAVPEKEPVPITDPGAAVPKPDAMPPQGSDVPAGAPNPPAQSPGDPATASGKPPLTNHDKK